MNHEVIKKLLDSGFEAYYVGGFVRDHLLGKEPKDIDITTNATPEQIKAVFPDHFVINPKFGTVVVDDIEITPYRIDGEYEDGRHPLEIKYVSDLKFDLARRDFTINALAMDINGSIIDIFGGRQDLENKIIRCVGDPKQRFQEDHLRILRMVRFQAQLGFEIDLASGEAGKLLSPSLDLISKERVQAELNKILLSDFVVKALTAAKELKVLNILIPEIVPCYNCQQKSKYHKYDVFNHLIRSVERCPQKDLIPRLALFLHDIGKPLQYMVREVWGKRASALIVPHPRSGKKLADIIMRRLKYPTYIIDTVTKLISSHDMLGGKVKLNYRDFEKMSDEVGIENVDLLIDVIEGDKLSHEGEEYDPHLDELHSFRTLCHTEPPLTVNDLALNGLDIMKILNIAAGPELKKIKLYLLEKVREDKLLNTKESLERLLGEYKSESII